MAFVPDAPGADLLVAIGETADGEPVAVAIPADAEGVSIESVMRYDATRALGARQLHPGARAGGSRSDAAVLADAWYLAHALIAAESLGAVQTCLEMSVAYAKERFTFGRAIGSYQAIKHELTEVLRLQENSRGLQYYAGWARDAKPEEFPLAASAARAEAGHALDYAARAMINVHGGIGATWEHDAPLFFRRAQLSRRLLGGTHDAVDRVAEQTLLASRHDLAYATPAPVLGSGRASSCASRRSGVRCLCACVATIVLIGAGHGPRSGGRTVLAICRAATRDDKPEADAPLSPAMPVAGGVREEADGGLDRSLAAGVAPRAADHPRQRR